MEVQRRGRRGGSLGAVGHTCFSGHILARAAWHKLQVFPASPDTLYAHAFTLS